MSLYICISTLWLDSGMKVNQQEVGPCIDGLLICPKLFPDLAMIVRASIVMLHTEKERSWMTMETLTSKSDTKLIIFERN